MRVITQRELRNNSAAVMDGVEAGETYRVSRNGVFVAELRPLANHRPMTAEELVARHQMLLGALAAELRAEADEFFGDDALDDPWERPRG